MSSLGLEAPSIHNLNALLEHSDSMCLAFNLSAYEGSCEKISSAEWDYLMAVGSEFFTYSISWSNFVGSNKSCRVENSNENISSCNSLCVPL